MGWIKGFLVLGVLLTTSTGFSNEEWETWGDDISTSGCGGGYKNLLKFDVQAACDRLEQTLYVMENYPRQIAQNFKYSTNVGVYLKNRAFYESRIRRRLRACRSKKLWLKCVGACNTQQETVAYVLVTLGYVHGTINFCDEHFSDPRETRATTMAHEYGRLEGIGDSPNYDTDNIYVWDGLLRTLGNPGTEEWLKTK